MGGVHVQADDYRKIQLNHQGSPGRFQAVRLSSLYNHVVKFGIERDPRKREAIDSFEDTAILHGHGDTEVRKMLVGIDIEVGELLLADQIRQKEGLDLVVAHHPEGRAWAALYEVMRLQIDELERLGIPRKVAQELMDIRKEEVARRILPHNHMRTVDVARILDIPFMCVHTPADNHVAHFIRGLLSKRAPRTVQGIVDKLMEIPEYKEATRDAAGPRVILGSPRRTAGKIFVEMTGGTEGSKDIFDKLYKVGVRTLVSMHLSDEHFKKVTDANLNVVVAGHISSDTLGLNLLLDRIEEAAKERFEVVSCSGFHRIRRN
jgi:putative NIF3 family GTP cyclohydrolase 1 type 2